MEATNYSNSCVDSGNTEEYHLPLAVTYSLIGLHAVSFVTTVIGNIYIIFASFTRGKERTSASYFLTALASSDLLLIFWCVPLTVYSNIINFHWHFGDFMCSTVGYMQTACVIQRAFILVTSSLDRHRAIWRPLQRPRSGRATLLTIALVILMSLLVPIPIAVYSDLVPVGEHNESLHCIEVWPTDVSKHAFSIILLILTYFLPLLGLLLTFGHMTKIVRSKPPGEFTSLEQQLMIKRCAAERQMIKVFLMEFVAYTFCWLPIHMITIYGEVKPDIYDDRNVHIVWLFAHWMAMSNSAITPIVFVATKSRSTARRQRRMSEYIFESSFNSKLRRRRMTQSSWL